MNKMINYWFDFFINQRDFFISTQKIFLSIKKKLIFFYEKNLKFEFALKY